MAFRTFTFSSRSDSLSTLAGGSIARLLKSWKRWFWTTSRIAPVCVVEAAAALDAEVFRHRDLHALDVGPVPERLEERIREAEEQHVVDGALSEVVVDPEDVALDERAEQDPIQIARRGEVVPEGLLDDDAGALGAAGLGQLFHDAVRRAAEGSRGSAPGARAPASSRRSASKVAGSL